MLLGAIIDKKLIFDIHTIDLCKKVSFKTRTLSMCAFLFDAEFKEILFKLFILLSYDFCSTLFFQKISSNFLKSSFILLKIMLKIKHVIIK